MLDHAVDLLTVHKTNNILIEYTTNCNLRCSYCAVSQLYWDGKDLEAADMVTQAAIARQPKVAVIHGHGETTTIKGWEKYAEAFHDAGIAVNICSNLSKTYSDREIEEFSKLQHLTVSIDTIDPELFQKLRRGGSLEQVLSNLNKIQEAIRSRGKEIDISWSIVCTDKNVWGLLDLVKHGIELGITAFTFCNLGTMPTPKGGLETNHVSEFSADDCRKVIDMFLHIEIVCVRSNTIFDMKDGLIDTLRAKADG